MKNQLWGYLRPFLLGVITATVLLWSLTITPAVANTTPPNLPLQRGGEEGFSSLHTKNGLVLSLPFAVESQWISVDNNTPGIVWTTVLPSTDGQADNQKIKFGIQNGKFIANANDTWFVYGWFGALKAIKQPYNIKYPAWGDRHNGIDFAGKEGLEIVSASVGKVIFAGKKIGNTVIVNAGNSYQITYGHMQDISVKKGQILQTGDLIGHLGKTGTTNPHLHFQIDSIKKDSRTAINPVPLFDAEWGRVIIPANAEANQFYTENQNPLAQPDFLW